MLGFSFQLDNGLDRLIMKRICAVMMNYCFLVWCGVFFVLCFVLGEIIEKCIQNSHKSDCCLGLCCLFQRYTHKVFLSTAWDGDAAASVAEDC